MIGSMKRPLSAILPFVGGSGHVARMRTGGNGPMILVR